MKSTVTVVYPITFEFDLPRNFSKLTDDELDRLKIDIFDEADKLFGNDSCPVIHNAEDSKGNVLEILID